MTEYKELRVKENKIYYGEIVRDNQKTTVTFEGTNPYNPSGYAVVQRGGAKMMVSRDAGMEILAGKRTVTFVSDNLDKKNRSRGRRVAKKSLKINYSKTPTNKVINDIGFLSDEDKAKLRELLK